MKKAATLENDKKRSQNKRDAETPEQKDRKRQQKQAVKDSQTQAEFLKGNRRGMSYRRRNVMHKMQHVEKRHKIQMQRTPP